MKILIPLYGSIFLFGLGLSTAAPIFEFNPTTYSLLLDSGMTVQGDLTVDETAGIIDFGSNGVARIDTFTLPPDTYTIESYVLVESFNDWESHYISTLVSNETWEGREQGFDLRFGGGIYYPALPEDANAWNSQSGGNAYSFSSSPEERAALSGCLAELAVATGTTHHYKEYFSRYCVNTGEWLHVVATWDGEAAALYINGKNVVDSLRINSPDLNPQIDSNIPLYIGAVGFMESDARHFNGKMRFVNIYDYALDPHTVKTIADSLHKEPEDPICEFSVEILSPLSGEVCTKDSRFVLEINDNGQCASTFASGDFEILIQASTNANFTEDLTEMTIDAQDFKMQELLTFFNDLEWRYLFWRFTVIPKTDALGKFAAAEHAHWSYSVPVFMQLDESSAVSPTPALEQLKGLFRKGYFINGRAPQHLPHSPVPIFGRPTK